MFLPQTWLSSMVKEVSIIVQFKLAVVIHFHLQPDFIINLWLQVIQV